MVTRRENDVSAVPVKRAAVWPRPRRGPGRWPVVPADVCRRAEDLPPLALPVCLSTLETKPCPLPRCFGALGRSRKSSSRRSLMAKSPTNCGVLYRVKHAGQSTLVRVSRSTRHGGDAASCRTTPTCRLTLRVARCRPLLSCLPPLPFADAQSVGGPAALCCWQAARRRTRQWPQAGRVRGKTPAHGMAVRSAAPDTQDWRSLCTRDDTLKAIESTCLMAQWNAENRWPSRASLQPNRACDADHGGCAYWAEVAAVERRRIGHAQQEQFARFKATTLLPG